MGRCTRTSAEITSIAVPATSKKLVSSNAWPTLATPLRSSHSRPRHKHVEPRSQYRREFVAWPEQVSFFLVDHRHCRPAANETMFGLRRAVGTEVVHWL